MCSIHLHGVLLLVSPFKISPGTLVFDVAKINQFSALCHLKRILAAVCSLARRSAAPPKGMEREDGICDLSTLHGMSCLTALHKKKFKLISSIKQPLAHRESGMLGYVIRSYRYRSSMNQVDTTGTLPSHANGALKTQVVHRTLFNQNAGN